jgi:hypothetical protein
MKVGVRVKLKRADLYHRLNDIQKQTIPKTIPNHYYFFGTVKGGNSENGWDIKFDTLPESDPVVTVVKKGGNNICVVRDGEEEKPLEASGGQEPIAW